jgi:hypothetical protein
VDDFASEKKACRSEQAMKGYRDWNNPAQYFVKVHRTSASIN